MASNETHRIVTARQGVEMIELESLVTRLKCGEYDGEDIMEAWINLERIAELEEQLRVRDEALAEIREVWAGSDTFIAEAALEEYLQMLLKQCYQISVDASGS